MLPRVEEHTVELERGQTSLPPAQQGGHSTGTSNDAALRGLAAINCTSIVPTIGPWEPKKEKIGKDERQTEAVMRLRLNKYVVKQYPTDGPLSSLLPRSPLLTSKAKKREKKERPCCYRHDLNICIHSVTSHAYVAYSDKKVEGCTQSAFEIIKHTKNNKKGWNQEAKLAIKGPLLFSSLQQKAKCVILIIIHFKCQLNW